MSFIQRLRQHQTPQPQPDGAAVAQRSRLRTIAAQVLTVLAILLVWFGLVAPNQLGRLTIGAFIRIPIEGLVALAVLLLLPPKPKRIVAMVVGGLLGVLTIVKILDIGFFYALDRPFNPITDWGNFGPAVGVLTDSIGHVLAILTVILVVILLVALVVFMMLSVARLTRLAMGQRTWSLRTVTALGVVWILCAVFGVQFVNGAPVASTTAAGLTVEQVREIRAGVKDQSTFAKSIASDPFRNTPAADLLTGLRGKDVMIAFVESYGQVAVQGSAFSPQVDAVLNAGTAKLNAAGYASKSAFLTSPTFGGISWLAHSTLQSGLWIDNQQRYDNLVTTDRFTLSDAFKRAGWRTVSDVPSDHSNWPVGTSFYHYATEYNALNVGYEGPKFSYASVPDQYTLAEFQKNELAQPHAPVMAEIDFVSSHTPWAPLPHMVDWNKLGDGSIYDPMPAQGESADQVWQDPNKVKSNYGLSIQYSLNSLISFVQTYNDKNLVLIVLGDHQPATIVSGADATHNVPITIISHDPAVMARIAGWGWQDGMLPNPQAPVWPMDDFRDRFLTAYGPQNPVPSASPAQN